MSLGSLKSKGEISLEEMLFSSEKQVFKIHVYSGSKLELEQIKPFL